MVTPKVVVMSMAVTSRTSLDTGHSIVQHERTLTATSSACGDGV
jgi:hypothetical protein